MTPPEFDQKKAASPFAMNLDPTLPPAGNAVNPELLSPPAFGEFHKLVPDDFIFPPATNSLPKVPANKS